MLLNRDGLVSLCLASMYAAVGLAFGLLWGAGAVMVYRAAGPAPAAAVLAVFYAFVLLVAWGG